MRPKVFFVFQDGVDEPIAVFLDKFEAHIWCGDYVEDVDKHARLRVHAAYYELI